MSSIRVVVRVTSGALRPNVDSRVELDGSPGPELARAAVAELAKALRQVGNLVPDGPVVGPGCERVTEDERGG